MKKILKYVFKLLVLALLIVCIWSFLPYAKSFFSELLNKMPYQEKVYQITHKMEQTGELVTVRYQDQNVLTEKMEALFLGEVQSLKVPYTYDIAFGVNLKKAQVTEQEAENGEKGKIFIYLDLPYVISDAFQVGEPEIKDFFKLLTEKKYQNILNEHHEKIKQNYLSDDEKMAFVKKESLLRVESLLKEMLGDNNMKDVVVIYSESKR